MNNDITNQDYSLTSSDNCENHHGLITKNYQSMSHYIDSLFSRHARLLVLRVDLTYRKDVDTPFLNDVEIYEKYWQALQDREHLFRNTRSNRLFDNMVGYIWKLELGKLKDWHTHFFFDGSQVREDISRADMIGEYWVNVITQGRGIYHNCNAHKEKYKRCGIGMINHYDTELIANLKQDAVPYLAKPDEYISAFMKDIDIGRTFGRGIRREKTENGGRPRIRTQLYP